MVLSVSKGSAGYVPVKGNVSTSGYVTVSGYEVGYFNGGSVGSATDIGAHMVKPDGSATYPALVTQSGTISPTGQADLTTKQYSAKLISATQLQTDGPVEWQVIEYA